VGASTLEGRVAISGRRVFLIGLSGGGEYSLVVGVGVKTLFGCHSLPCGSSAAATMMCVSCSHEFVENVVLMSSIRQPLSHRNGGVPVSGNLRRALCTASMCLRVMQIGGMSCGCLSPRRRWRVVLMANVPHDHAGKGVSFWIAIISTLLYRGRVMGEPSIGKGLVDSAV